MGGASEASAEKSYCRELVILKSPDLNFFRSDAECGLCDRCRSGNPGPAKAGRNCNEEPGFLDFLQGLLRGENLKKSPKKEFLLFCEILYF